MEIDGLAHPVRYAPLETALQEAGLVVEGVKKQGKRTVITVFRPGRGGESSGAAREETPGTTKPGGEEG